MSTFFKKSMIFIYLTSLYVYIMIGYLYFLIFFILFHICFFYIFYTKNALTFSIILKSIFFGVFIFYFTIFDSLIVGIFLCGMDGMGYLQRSGIVDFNYACYKFTLQETLLLDFVSSLHYPIYIFIFFKPFVNHLDESIRKIREKGNKG